MEIRQQGRSAKIEEWNNIDKSNPTWTVFLYYKNKGKTPPKIDSFLSKDNALKAIIQHLS